MMNHLVYAKERWSCAQAGIEMLAGLEDYSRTLVWRLVFLNTAFGL